MMQRIKIKVRPNQPVRFPALCVHCAGRTDGDWMGLRRRIERVTRLIDVPVCPACAGELRRQSLGEERWSKVGLLLSGLAALVALALVLIILPAALLPVLRWGAALVAAGFAAAAVFSLSGRVRDRAALPSKQAIRRAAAIGHFNWQVTTFEFTNDLFAQQFAAVNETAIMR